MRVCLVWLVVFSGCITPMWINMSSVSESSPQGIWLPLSAGE